MTNLKRIRTATGLSQSQLAEAAEMSLRTLQHYEQGTRDINKAQGLTLLTLARALNVSIEDILELENIKETKKADGAL